MSDALRTLVMGRDLSEADASALLKILTDPRTEPAWSGAALGALQTKGPTAVEVRGFAAGMRRLARTVALPQGSQAIDIVGTGGDGSGSFNLSTGAALLTAACGVPVVKHGNRGVSSSSGSSDVLEALGYSLPESPESALAGLDRHGFTFLHAPFFHPAMRSVGSVRRAMGVRTIFNILGPLTNPAAPPFAVIGAYSPRVATLMAEALAGLGVRRAFVVHGENGWDEATPAGPFQMWDVREGRVSLSLRDPLDAGVQRFPDDSLRGGDPTYNAGAIRDAFEGGDAAHRAALALTAGLALEVCGAALSLEEGVNQALAAIEGGDALRLLEGLS